MQIMFMMIFIVFFKRFKKINDTSFYATFKIGLNESRITTGGYYFHYFASRILLSILIVFTNFTGSIYLWIIFLIFEILFVLTQCLKIFRELPLRLTTIFSELLILLIAIYGIICQTHGKHNT